MKRLDYWIHVALAAVSLVLIAAAWLEFYLLALVHSPFVFLAAYACISSAWLFHAMTDHARRIRRRALAQRVVDEVAADLARHVDRALTNSRLSRRDTMPVYRQAYTPVAKTARQRRQ